MMPYAPSSSTVRRVDIKVIVYLDNQEVKSRIDAGMAR